MLLEKLFDFQKEIVEKYYTRQRFGLFLDMGLGKTITSLAFVEKNNIDRVIVISLKAKVDEDINIKGSFDDYLNQLGFNINKINDAITNDYTKDALVVNYERLQDKRGSNDVNKNIVEFLKFARGKKIAIIVDESHKIKNAKSKRSLALNKIINIANNYSNLYLYLLTGTPFTQGLIDLHHQLNLLGVKMSKTDFINNFAIRGNIKGLYEWQQPIVAYKNTKMLYKLMDSVSVHMLTENAIKLPEQKFYEYITKKSIDFEMFTNKKIAANILSKYMKVRNLKTDVEGFLDTKNVFFRNISYPNEEYFADTAANFWLRARQLSIGFQGNAEKNVWYNVERLNLLKNFLKDKTDNFICFYNYSAEFEKLFNIFYDAGYKIDVYNGDIKDLYFYEEYENMNDGERLIDNKKRVILANYASGGTGKNWQLYNNTILFSLPLYGVYAQALKRNHRIGQKNTTHYHIFYQDNFLDNEMLTALKEKVEYNNEMFMFNINKLN